MDNLQVAAPATPVTAAKAATAGAPDGCEAPPWVAAFQAALTHHAKGLQMVPMHGAVAKDPGDPPAAAATDADDKRQVPADASLAAAPTALPLPLLVALPPIPAAAPPAPPATPPLAARADTHSAHDNDALAAPSAASNADRRVAAETQPADMHDAARPSHAATDVAANSDTVMRMIEHATARDGNVRDINAQPQAQFALTQAAPATPPPAALPAAQLQVNANVGSAAWGAELGQKVVWMIGEQQHVAELRVNPPDLGPLDIKLTVTDHQTTAVFTSPHGAVRDAVESALPRLREVLAESGIMLGNASVTADSPRDGSAFAAPHDQAQRGNGHPRVLESASAPTQSMTTHLTRRNGLVDLFA